MATLCSPRKVLQAAFTGSRRCSLGESEIPTGARNPRGVLKTEAKSKEGGRGGLSASPHGNMAAYPEISRRPQTLVDRICAPRILSSSRCGRETAMRPP